MWNVSSRSGVETLRTAIHLLLTNYFTKFVFGAGGTCCAPSDRLAGLRGTLLLTGRGEEGKGRYGRGEGTPLTQIPEFAPEKSRLH